MYGLTGQDAVVPPLGMELLHHHIDLGEDAVTQLWSEAVEMSADRDGWKADDLERATVAVADDVRQIR